MGSFILSSQLSQYLATNVAMPGSGGMSLVIVCLTTSNVGRREFEKSTVICEKYLKSEPLLITRVSLTCEGQGHDKIL